MFNVSYFNINFSVFSNNLIGLLSRMDKREKELRLWLSKQLDNEAEDLLLSKLAGDAGFRKYYRFESMGNSLIAMDADPRVERPDLFHKINKIFLDFGLNVPDIYAHDLQKGFMVIEDFGSETFLQKLNNNNVDTLYGKAIGSLITLQQQTMFEGFEYLFMNKIVYELSLFNTWFTEYHLQINLEYKETKVLDELYNLLSVCLLQQPQVIIHRDFHSQNLMFTKNNNPGIIDFQDAVIGPITYDLVSLLKDCYIDWPQAKLNKWLLDYKLKIEECGLIKNISDEQFIYWFDLTGLQRHLKVLGVFTRLKVRDKKSKYIEYFPRIFNYILSVLDKYPELNDFKEFFYNRVVESKGKLEVNEV